MALGIIAALNIVLHQYAMSITVLVDPRCDEPQFRNRPGCCVMNVATARQKDSHGLIHHRLSNAFNEFP